MLSNMQKTEFQQGYSTWQEPYFPISKKMIPFCFHLHFQHGIPTVFESVLVESNVFFNKLSCVRAKHILRFV